jgi:hypothetical protein
LPEALSRGRNAAASQGSTDDRKKKRGSWAASRIGRLFPTKTQGFVSAAMAAVVVGIVINALALQHERHPAPFFAAAPAASSMEPKIAAPIVAATEPAPSSPPAVAAAPASVASPPVRPAGLGAATSSTKSADPIADMLRGTNNRETRRLLSAAQAALVKLGYPIRNSGVVGADTTAALREFEKSRHLPISGELTPHIVRELVEASDAEGTR